jgi:Putative zinc-finger
VKGHADAETLAAFREGLLSRRRAARVSAHLAACPRCAESDARLAGITALLASAPAPPMPAGLSARIEAALAAEAAARAAAGAPDGVQAAGDVASRPSGDTPAGKATGPGSGSDIEETAGASGGIALTGSGGTIPRESAGAGSGTAPPETAGAGRGADAGETGRAGRDVPANRTTGAGHRAGGRGVPSAGGPPAGRPPTGPRRHRRAGNRSRRRSWVAVRAGAVAAAVAVIVGGGYGVAQLIGSGTTAGTSASGSAASRSHAAAGSEKAPANRMAPSSGELGLPVVRSGTNYQPGQLGTQVKAVLARHPLPPARSSQGGNGAAPAPFSNSASLPACVRRVSGGVAPRLVDLATYQGTPATVIVIPAGGDRVRVLVVGRGCTGAASDVLAQASVATGH